MLITKSVVDFLVLMLLFLAFSKCTKLKPDAETRLFMNLTDTQGKAIVSPIYLGDPLRITFGIKPYDDTYGALLPYVCYFSNAVNELNLRIPFISSCCPNQELIDIFPNLISVNRLNDSTFQIDFKAFIFGNKYSGTLVGYCSLRLCLLGTPAGCEKPCWGNYLAKRSLIRTNNSLKSTNTINFKLDIIPHNITLETTKTTTTSDDELCMSKAGAIVLFVVLAILIIFCIFLTCALCALVCWRANQTFQPFRRRYSHREHCHPPAVQMVPVYTPPQEHRAPPSTPYRKRYEMSGENPQVFVMDLPESWARQDMRWKSETDLTAHNVASSDMGTYRISRPYLRKSYEDLRF